MILLFTTSFWNSLSASHASKPQAKTAGTASQQINIPYFPNAVAFNQTAIFWFGKISSTDTYTDVRIGYNSTELFIDLHIVDRYLWYDTNTSAPIISNYDNASIYLDTTSNASSTLDQNSYQFQTGVNGFKKRTNYQQAYIPKSNSWTPASVPFTAVYGWRGHGFNGAQDKGWSMTYHIPFSSLHLSAPAQGTSWKLAVKVHNRDDAANTPLPDEWWPQSASQTNPSSWGVVAFGLPTSQQHASTGNTVTIRNKVNGQTVTDAMVGGGLGCGSNVSDVWTQLGNTSYPGATQVTVENEADISDWNCFSKFYITFPLSSLQGSGVTKAIVTLFEYSNAGTQGQPNPSYIQVATVNQANMSSLTWNNAPPVQQNFGSIVVNTKTKKGVLPPPGLPFTWDVTASVAQAYAAGQSSISLVFYSTDNQYNTGKYFWSSSVGDWNANGRPELQVTS